MGIFVTVTVQLKEELLSLSRGSTAAERVGRQSKCVKTSATCASRNALDVPQQKRFLEQ